MSGFLRNEDVYKDYLLCSEPIIEILKSPIMCSDMRTEAKLAALLSWRCFSMYHKGFYEEAAFSGTESTSIIRNILDNGADDLDMHERNLSRSLLWLAKCLHAAGNGDAALLAVDEAIDILIEKEVLVDISDGLAELLFLRVDILFCLGPYRSPDDRDALLESLLLEITPGSVKDSESVQ